MWLGQKIRWWKKIFEKISSIKFNFKSPFCQNIGSFFLFGKSENWTNRRLWVKPKKFFKSDMRCEICDKNYPEKKFGAPGTILIFKLSTQWYLKIYNILIFVERAVNNYIFINFLGIYFRHDLCGWFDFG